MDLWSIIGIMCFTYCMIVYGTIIRLNSGETVKLIFELQKPFNIVSPEKWFNTGNTLFGAILWILSPIIWLCGFIILYFMRGLIERLEKGGPF